jgi:hypothetical protein
MLDVYNPVVESSTHDPKVKALSPTSGATTFSITILSMIDFIVTLSMSVQLLSKKCNSTQNHIKMQHSAYQNEAYSVVWCHMSITAFKLLFK